MILEISFCKKQKRFLTDFYIAFLSHLHYYFCKENHPTKFGAPALDLHYLCIRQAASRHNRSNKFGASALDLHYLCTAFECIAKI